MKNRTLFATSRSFAANMNRRAVPLVMGLLLLELGCGGDDPTEPPRVLQPSELCSDNSEHDFVTFEDPNLDRALRPAAGAPVVLTCGLVSERTLLIATGTIRGKYYDTGKRMQLVLGQAGIRARAIHTDGSLENLGLLAANVCPTLAIVQYDMALASLWDPHAYKPDIPAVKGLRRIAVLHEQKVHVVMRRDRIPPEMRERPTLAALDGARVAVGPRNSGTQVTVKKILRHQGITPGRELNFSIADMVEHIHSGEIDAGFFVSHVPSEALKAILQDDHYRLLSIDPKRIAGLSP